MRTIDRAKTTRAEVDKAIAEAVRSGETLTITHHGVPKMQVCQPSRIVGYEEGEVEEYPRKAQTKLADGTVIEREWSPHERYMLYVRGFGDGAVFRAMKHEGYGAYDRGYADGQKARGLAAKNYAEEVGYEPTVLRTATQPNCPDTEGESK